MWNPDAFLDQLYGQLQASRSGREEKRERKSARLKETLAAALGDFADWAEPLPDSRQLEREELDGAIRERVEYSTCRGLRVPAYVIRPKGAADRKLPAIVALHGHGYGSREMAGLLPDGQPCEPMNKQGQIVMELVSRGYLVLVPEIVGFGDRRLQRDAEQPDPAASSCFPLAAALLLAGKTLAGLRVYETMRAVDYLMSRMDVNTARIGCIGFSGGGMVASLAAALDERIQAAVLCGYANTYRGSILARRHCLDNYIPGILRHAEMPELLGLIAPRPLFIESGLRDPLFPIVHVLEAVNVLKRIYRETGAEENLDFDLFDGGHEMSGGASLDWLEAVL